MITATSPDGGRGKWNALGSLECRRSGILLGPSSTAGCVLRDKRMDFQKIANVLKVFYVSSTTEYEHIVFWFVFPFISPTKNHGFSNGLTFVVAVPVCDHQRAVKPLSLGKLTILFWKCVPEVLVTFTYAWYWDCLQFTSAIHLMTTRGGKSELVNVYYSSFFSCKIVLVDT